ncbi:MAG: hypothetical protein JWQ14_3450 [Adhaeribacter sp.]|nr:hypothetical protein [Adhaeribacter sp.]
MGKGYFGKIKQLYASPVDAWSLAFFRMAYSLVLLLEVQQIFTYLKLIFSEVPHTSPALITGLLVLWALALGFLLIGWYTRLAAGINYAISVFILWQMPAFKYHFDFVMTSVNFLLLWLPVSAGFSLDAYLRKKQRPEITLPDQVSGLYVWLLVIMGIGLVYLDSAVNKLGSSMWLSGLGFWLPSSQPQNALVNLSWVLNQEYLVRVIGYGILLFEFLFIFLIWFRPLRLFLVTVGVLLHLGICIAYPIPHFAWLMLALYIPLLPDAVWQKLRQAVGKIKRIQPGAHLPVSPTVTGETNRKSHRIGLFILYISAGQLMCMLAAPVVQHFVDKSGLKPVVNFSQNLFKPFYFINQKFLGIVSHDIFLDKHSAGYNQIFNISYSGENGKILRLPLFTSTGQPGKMGTGRIGTKWTDRVTGPNPQAGNLQDGIRKFTAFWAQQQGILLEKAVFLIQVKKVAVPLTWEKDFLNRQMQQPWETIGKVFWEDGQCRIEWL